MVDRDESHELSERPSELYRQGKDKPPEVKGFVWVPVRGLDPTKPPGEPSGWRGLPLPNKPSDEFVIPPEVQVEEERRRQADAGVGSFAARTEAGMRRAEERREALRGEQKKPEEVE
jgi:hypothetical protein